YVKRIAQSRHSGHERDHGGRALPRAPALEPYLSQLQFRPRTEAARRRSLNAEVVHSDLLEIRGPITPVIGGPHSIFRALLFRHSVELVRRRKRRSARRVGIIVETDVAVARAAA